MAKNLIIFILMALCGFLAYLHFNRPEPEPIPSVNCPLDCPPPEIPEEKETRKISPYEAIKMAKVHDISLETPMEDVDDLIEQAEYSCKKNETKPEEKPQAITWQCKHESGAALHVIAKDGKIQKIARSGAAYTKDMDMVLDQLDDLKARLSTRKGFNTSQSNKNMTFQIQHEKEDNSLAFIKFHTHYPLKADPEKQEDKGGVLTAIITR